MTGFPPKNKKDILRPIVIAVLISAGLFLSVIFLSSHDVLSNSPESSPSQNAQEASKAAPAAPVSNVKRYDFKLSESDTFYHALSVLDVPGADIKAITELARQIYDLRHLKKDSILKVITLDGKLDRIEYKFSDVEVLHVERDGKSEKGFSISKTDIPHELREARVTGTIENSLYEDGVKAGADPQAIMQLSDIFAWDIDFASDIRKGDAFSIVYEALYVEGRPVRAGRVLGAEMVNDGKKFTAVYYDDKAAPGYYNAEGKSLARSLLKSPLRFRRITSTFGRRFHPILKKYRPHHGIDYAASSGTPVESAGSGRVTYAGWKGGYGNFIEIRHNNGYVTAYGHLSRISKGVKTGAKVSQGDVIGLVGSTGISTGPHLHYEVKSGGRLINPLSIKSVPDRSLNKKEMLRFASIRDDVFRRLAGEPVLASSKDVVPAQKASGTDTTPIKN